jgi:hypothetical protein
MMPPRRTGFNENTCGGIDRNVDVAEADVDNLNAGGFFARYGREQNGPAQRPSRRTPLEGHHRGHRVATGGGRGGGREGVIEVSGGCRVA